MKSVAVNVLQRDLWVAVGSVNVMKPFNMIYLRLCPSYRLELVVVKTGMGRLVKETYGQRQKISRW